MACKCQSIKPRKSSVELQPLILELLEILLVYPVNQILKLVGVAGIQLLFRVGGMTGFRPPECPEFGIDHAKYGFQVFLQRLEPPDEIIIDLILEGLVILNPPMLIHCRNGLSGHCADKFTEGHGTVNLLRGKTKLPEYPLFPGILFSILSR